MTAEDVKVLAEPLLRRLFDHAVETVDVLERDDWSGAPSLYIDVFLAPGTGAPDPDAWIRLRRSLSDELVASGEPRFPYFQLRDRKEESEDAPDEAS